MTRELRCTVSGHLCHCAGCDSDPQGLCLSLLVAGYHPCPACGDPTPGRDPDTLCGPCGPCEDEDAEA